MEVTPQDRFIVLASDGVWEFISSQEAVDIIAQYPTAEESCRQVSRILWHTPCFFLTVAGSVRQLLLQSDGCPGNFGKGGDTQRSESVPSSAINTSLLSQIMVQDAMRRRSLCL